MKCKFYQSVNGSGGQCVHKAHNVRHSKIKPKCQLHTCPLLLIKFEGGKK
jgi:hypothetical protein